MSFKSFITFAALRKYLKIPTILITLAWAATITLIFSLPRSDLNLPVWRKRPVWLDKMEGIARNQLFLLRDRIVKDERYSPHPEVVIIGVDEKSFITSFNFEKDFLQANPDLDQMRQWPFPRALHGKLIEKLVKAGAKVVIFDMMFSSDSMYGPEDDDFLSNKILQYKDHVVVGTNLIEDNSSGGLIRTYLGSDVVIPEQVETSDVVGLVNYFPSSDGAIRTATFVLEDPLSVSQQKDLPPTILSIDGLGIHKAHPELPLPEVNERFFINFSGPRNTFPVIEYYKLFHPDYTEKNIPFYTGGPKGWATFKDKIVLVGPRGNFLHDEHITPYDMMPGVEIHANAISTFLKGNQIHALPPGWVQNCFVFMTGIIYAFVLFRIDSAVRKLIWMVFLIMMYILLALYLFVFHLYLIPLIPPGLILLFAASNVSIYQGWVEQMERKRMSQMLHRYVSKNVAEELIEKGEDIRIPKKRFITILFSDVRDFTTMTEKSDPEQLMAQLSEYMNEMVECVFRHHGTLDKFVGDAIMAVFGSPTSQGNKQDALNAVRATLEMRDELSKLNEKWEKEGKPSFRIGIGLNAGEAMTGEFGSKQKVEFGAIGDSVNVASRVEGLNKGQGTDILITENVYQFVSDMVIAEERGDIPVKGRAEPVKVFALLALNDQGEMH